MAQATALPRWDYDSRSEGNAGNNSYVASGGEIHPWLASWAADGGDDERLSRLGLSCYWAVYGLALLAATTLALRRCLCPHPVHLREAAVKGNLSAGIVDAVAVLAAGAMVSGVLPPRAQSETEAPLSFVEQNIAAALAVACTVTAVVLFGLLLKMFHFGGRSADFVTEKVKGDKYQLKVQLPETDGPLVTTRLLFGNPVKAILYGSCVVSYSIVLGKAAAASVELLFVAVWAGAGCLILLLVAAALAKQMASGFSRKHDFRKMSEKHNWGYGLVVGATIFAFGLAIAGLIPDRGCGCDATAAAADAAAATDRNGTAESPTSAHLFEVPSELAALQEESLGTEAAVAALVSVDNGLALVLALVCMVTTRTFYQLPLCCVGGASAKKKRSKKSKKKGGRADCCGFGAVLRVTESVTSGHLHAVSISFAGYTVAVGNILAATLGPPASGVPPLGPRLSAALQDASAAASGSSDGGGGGDTDTMTFVLSWGSATLREVSITAGPQLAWTAMSYVMMVAAHYVHLVVISWQMPSNSDSDSDDDDEDEDGRSGVAMKAVERLQNNDCAYGVMEGGLHITSSFIIAASCAGRGLSGGDIAAGWLGFAAGEAIVFAFGAATAWQGRRRRRVNGSDSDDEGGCCCGGGGGDGGGRRQGKRSKKKERREMLKASRAPGPGQTVGQSLNWCLNLTAWVLLLLGPLRSSVVVGGGMLSATSMPMGDLLLFFCVWAVLGSAVLLGAQRVVMELVLSRVSDALDAEQQRDPDLGVEAVENWGPGLVGGMVSVGLSMVLVGLLPPPPC